ncbi:MAG: iron ABC transporter permease [Chloroflexi bacterium]|nr:iron ABC transporter permease [Chloroflexota bacterium]
MKAPAATRGQTVRVWPWPRRASPLLVATALLIVASISAVALGKAAIPLDVQAQIIGHRLLGLPVAVTWPTAYETIVLHIRLPRIVLAALVGAALAAAGVGYQGLFRNPLADPYLMGVASGAGLGAVLAMVLPSPPGWSGLGLVQAFAFAGALLTVAAVILIARVGRTTPLTTLVLAGVAVGALASAGMAFLLTLRAERLVVANAWLLGGFGVAGWREVWLVAPLVAAAIGVLALTSRLLNALQGGDDDAASLGVPVQRLMLVVVGAATLATAAAVSAAGLIGFVGLIVPHTARLLTGPDHRRLLPVAALAGAAFLLAADTVARSLPGAGEVPVGVITAACGAPFFLALLRRQKRGLL